MNLLVALTCFFIVTNPISILYGVINLFFAIFSILPSKGTDGYCCYQILKGQILIHGWRNSVLVLI